MKQDTCAVDGCTKPTAVRGWCHQHYARWQRHGDTGTTLRPRVDGPCAVDGCDDPPKARGWCDKHWKRWNRWGDPTATAPQTTPAGCATAGCPRPVKTAGKCGACYIKARRAATPKTPLPKRECIVCGEDLTSTRKDATLCSTKCRNAARYKVPRVRTVLCSIVENDAQCTDTATHQLKTDVWCKKHHTRYERHGDPLAVVVEQRPHGEVQQLLAAAAASTADDCVMIANPKGGRLTVTLDGEPMTASRAVWTIAHGAAGEAHILHTCHQGDEGCANIRHLYLGDHTSNMVDMVESDRSAHGENHGNHKLKEEQVREICLRARAGESQLALAAEFGISRSQVSNIKLGKAWWRVTAL
ncbi:hypothetical protein ACH4RG_22945 [Streptomyces sp. NPDC021019]|uniref:hypothetical protein n=1 Tax=Streptomyces sp. NPDC021019 TaxID=3365108 RepID=UPI0037AD3BFF